MLLRDQWHSRLERSQTTEGCMVERFAALSAWWKPRQLCAAEGIHSQGSDAPAYEGDSHGASKERSYLHAVTTGVTISFGAQPLESCGHGSTDHFQDLTGSGRGRGNCGHGAQGRGDNKVPVV